MYEESFAHVRQEQVFYSTEVSYRMQTVVCQRLSVSNYVSEPTRPDESWLGTFLTISPAPHVVRYPFTRLSSHRMTSYMLV